MKPISLCRRLCRFLAIGGIALLTAVPTKAEEAVSKLDRELAAEYPRRIRPLLQRYCYDCHQGESAEASVDLSKGTDLQSIREAASLWEQVRGLVRIEAMPPLDHDRLPTTAEREQLSDWIDRALHAFDCDEPYSLPPVTVRRLNRAEYDATIRDLFGIEGAPSTAVGFVSDDVGNGFDNQGEVLSVSPLVFEKYAQAAEWVAERVVLLDPDVLREQTTYSDPIYPGRHFDAEFLFAEGEYEISARIKYGRRGSVEAPVKVYLDGSLLDEVIVVGSGRNWEWTRTLSPGKHTLRFRFLDKGEEPVESRGHYVVVDRVSVIGPQDGSPPMPIPHQRVIVASPDANTTVEQAASKIVANLLPRAYRRPTTAAEEKRIVDIIVAASQQEWSFLESVRFGIQAILIAPEFLFRLEGPAGGDAEPVAAPENAGPISMQFSIAEQYELASRLSYFLWSSMPDEDLFELASGGKLAEPEMLRSQLARMLQDPRAEALVRGFFEQWLGIRNLATVSVDEEEFGEWTLPLREALAKETFLFCQHLMRHGSLGDILSADYTFVNPRLADFYQLPFEGQDASQLFLGSRDLREYQRRIGNYRDEDRWIQVSLPDYRRGLLTHASILTLTSNPTRTSPVKRGKWVLENILGDPPPPAPPGVPPLDEEGGSVKKLSLRQQLELHRANPSCASCHRVLDPIGLGLENFDPIGRWRTHDNGVAIDAQGEFADGRVFSGPSELLQHLEKDRAKISKHFATQLLTYALGRGLTRSDQCELEVILAQAQANGDSIRSFLEGVVTSRVFMGK